MFLGSGVALVTPFRDGKIDEESLKNLIEEQIKGGTQFLVPCGTTGESATLSHEEHDRVIELTVEIAAGRIPVLAGAGSNSTREAIRLTKHAKQAGAQGALQINPYYNKPTQEGLFQHFNAIAKAVDFPLILYNIPSRTGINMTPQTTARLAKIDCIVGIKEASGSLNHVSDILELCDENFTVLSGEDALTFPMLVLGVKGAISVTANLLPEKCAAMFAAVEKNQWSVAKNIHFELAAINRALFVETNPAPIKTALALLKKMQLELRLPLVPLQEENLAVLKNVMQTYGLL